MYYNIFKEIFLVLFMKKFKPIEFKVRVDPFYLIEYYDHKKRKKKNANKNAYGTTSRRKKNR